MRPFGKAEPLEAGPGIPEEDLGFGEHLEVWGEHVEAVKEHLEVWGEHVEAVKEHLAEVGGRADCNLSGNLSGPWDSEIAETSTQTKECEGTGLLGMLMNRQKIFDEHTVQRRARSEAPPMEASTPTRTPARTSRTPIVGSSVNSALPEAEAWRPCFFQIRL